MVLSCTKKVRDRIKTIKEVENVKLEDGFYNWYVDAITLQRKKYFLFTHSESLFSFFIYLDTKDTLLNLELVFQEKLREIIIRDIGTSEKFQKAIIPKDPKFRFVKTNSRSILASVKDIKYHLEWRFEGDGINRPDHDLIQHKMNEMPIGIKGYKNAKELMLEALIKRVAKY